MKSHHSKILIPCLLILSLSLLLPTTTGGINFAQSPLPTPASQPTATPALDPRGDTISGDIMASLIVLVVGGAFGAIGTYFLKPHLDRWLKRQHLKREAREREKDREIQKEAARRRAVKDERLQAYLDRVGDLYSTTRIFGQTKPRSLDDIFTDVCILDQPQAFRRFDIRKLRADPGRIRDAERVPGLELLHRTESHRLFILGKPGVGKTTFLRYLTRQAATGTIDKIPLFITLGEWADSGDDLLTFIVGQFEICDFPHARPYVEHLLEDTDEALVLFDGLDEIRREGGRRDEAINSLRDFSRRYSRAQILITCRVAATEYAFPKFTYVEVADFDDAQIETFVGKWFRDAPTKRDLFLEELAKGKHRGLRELARVPLLLAMLCLTFDVNTAFPRRRVEIYADALDALLRKWDKTKLIRRDEIYQNLSLGRKHQMFARLAAQTFDLGEYFLPQEQLEDQIAGYLRRLPPADKPVDTEVDGTTILMAIEEQHGILVERAHRIYCFAHLSFQEYYTARYVADNAPAGTLSLLLSHTTDDRWREVILLTAAMLSNSDVLFERFLQILDDLVRDDPELVAFLTWASRKAASVKAEYKSAALRGYYCCLARDLETSHKLACISGGDSFRNLARILGLSRSLVRDLYLVHDFTPARTPDFVPVHNLTRVSARGFDLANRDLNDMLALARNLSDVHDLDRVLAPDLARVPDLDFADALAHAKYLSKELGLDALYQDISNLVPPKGIDFKGWYAFADTLQAMIIEHCNIGHDWDFDKEQSARLERYFYAAELFVRGLDLAYVTDRAAIENRFLLPPRVQPDPVSSEPGTETIT